MKSGRSSVYGNDFVNGKSRREASSKFDNHRVSDGFSKGSANEIVRERDTDRERDSDRRRRDVSTERGAEREPRRSGDIPCKFFAAGNCRNKKFCRFSHHIQSHVSSERRSRDDRWGFSHNLNDTDQAWDGPKWNDTVTPSDSAKLSPGNTGRSRDGRWALGHNINDADQAWDGPKWSDTVTPSESAKLSADNNGNIGVPEIRSGAWSMNDNRWGHGLNNENQMHGDPSVSHEAAKRNEKEPQLWKEDNVGASKSKDTEKWLGDMSPDWNYTLQSSNIVKEEHGHIARSSESLRLNDTSLNACKQDMSPDWNYTLQSSNNIGREEHGHIARGSESSRLNDTSLKACNQDIIREASGQVHGAASIMQPMIAERSNYLQNQDMREGGSIGLPHDGKNSIERTASSANIMSHQSFDQSVQSSSAFPFQGLTIMGQSQTLIPTHTQGLENPQDTLSAQRKSVIKLDVGDSKTSLVTGLPPVPNVVGGKDLTQLTSLSVSLAQLLENGHQLPQLYAALHSHNALNAPPFSKSDGSSEQLSAIQPDPAMSEKPYDPICDSMELKKHELSNNSVCVPNSTGKTGVDGKLEKPSDDYHQIRNSVEEPKRKSHQLSQPDPAAKSEDVYGNNELGLEERKKVEEENNSPENGPLEVIDKEGADEGKKLKEVKGIRAFKFALAEFVKELLKPTWKEGQVSKDAYKTIVKKVVDKVTGTIPGASIPQTQEKIDSYLSFSKPKLTKLVQVSDF